MSWNNNNRNFSSLVTIGVTIAAFIFGGYYIKRQLGTIHTRINEVAKDLEKETRAVKVVPTTIKSGNGQAASWIDVQEAVKNTVVKIIVDHAVFDWLEPYKTPTVGAGSGSGFFIDSDGYLVTNYHVVNQAKCVQIEIPVLGIERLIVDVVGVSPERDIALLKLSSDAKKKIEKALGGSIPFLKFGNSDSVRRGQDVLALGYPLGVQALKSTQGIVSGRERIKIIKQSCIQTTAPLNPGNSGGPAINLLGEVVGINFAGVIEAQNVGYMIPINDVKSAIKDLHKIKLLHRPLLGCLLEPSNDAMVSYLGNPEPGGYYVAQTFKNMMFEKVGILAGDMIYEINGFKLDKFGRASVPWNEDKVSMVDILDRLEVGDKVDLVVYRKGERKTFDFILEPRFLQPIRFIYPDFEEVDYELFGGVVIMELRQNHIPLLAEGASALIAYSSAENQYDSALVVSYIQPTSVASKMQLLYPGAVLTEINGVPVQTLAECRTAVQKSKKSRYLTLRTKDHLFVVFSIDELLKDEDRLAKMYQFKKSSLIDDIK